MKKFFCEQCFEDRECTYKESNEKEIIDNIEIEYLEKYYICNECGNKIYGDMFDYNIHEANKKLREHTGLITIDEIEEILEKYNIGKKPLSLVLGLGEITVTRYLNGQNPTKENSDLLKSVLNNPHLYEIFLLGNKDKVSEIAFKKSLGKTKQLELSEEHSKIYNTALYIVNRLEEVTALSLQKLLYFIDGFSKEILSNRLFNEEPEAWSRGPVYREIYNCFSYYKGDNINYKDLLKDYEFNLRDEEKEYLDEILKNFGCYSGNILKEMTHLTDPWITTREGLNEDEPSERIITQDIIDNYFNKICKEYDINNIKDIKKYSDELFKKAANKIFE